MKNFSAKYRVYYEDTDAQGIIYYGNYLRFAERARTDFLRLGDNMSQSDLTKRTGVFFVVRKVVIEYIAPGRLDDELKVTAEVVKMGRTSFDMKQEFFNQNNVKLAEMSVQIVCVANEGEKLKSVRIPENLIKHFS
jgi:acyl-CoA thioester hydrolase